MTFCPGRFVLCSAIFLKLLKRKNKTAQTVFQV